MSDCEASISDDSYSISPCPWPVVEGTTRCRRHTISAQSVGSNHDPSSQDNAWLTWDERDGILGWFHCHQPSPEAFEEMLPLIDHAALADELINELAAVLRNTLTELDHDSQDDLDARCVLRRVDAIRKQTR